MPSDYYLLVKSIDGESQAADMEKNIELESWSWGASNPASLGGKGLAAGKPSLSDFTCSFSLEAASPKLIEALCKGTHLDSFTFTGRKTGGDGKPYKFLIHEHKNCFITSFSMGGGSTGVPTASLSIAYEAMSHKYFSQDTKSGSVSLVAEAKYDIKQVKVG